MLIRYDPFWGRITSYTHPSFNFHNTQTLMLKNGDMLMMTDKSDSPIVVTVLERVVKNIRRGEAPYVKTLAITDHDRRLYSAANWGDHSIVISGGYKDREHTRTMIRLCLHTGSF